VKVARPGTAPDAVFITTLLDSKKFPRWALRNLYHHRWSEEEFFKTIKEHLRAEEFRGKTVQFIDQELLSTYLYYVLTRILMLEAAWQHDLPVATLETKAALIATVRYLDRLWLAESLAACRDLLRRCLKSPGAPTGIDPVVSSRAYAKVVTANGLTGGLRLKSTALGVWII
jgi:hypothetical protein